MRNYELLMVDKEKLEKLFADNEKILQ